MHVNITETGKNSNIIIHGAINKGYVTRENRKGSAVKKHIMLFEFAHSIYVSVSEQSLHKVSFLVKSFLFILPYARAFVK